MSLVTRFTEDLITIKEQAAKNLICPFTRESEFNEYSDTKCKITDCMSWVKVVDTTIENNRACPDGYEDMKSEMFDALYGNRPREYNKYYFIKTEKPGDEKGYCLRLQGCIK